MDLGFDRPLSVLRAGATSYYQSDVLSSVTSLSNSPGALANTYTYDSFGKLTASGGTLTNPFRYTAREFDTETNLYYYRARYYDPNTGRFLSEDPIGFRGGIDFYAYVGNNAANHTDPDGNAFKTCAKALADLANAASRVAFRLGEIQFHGGNPDPAHQKELQIAINNLNEAVEQVKKYCNCDKDAALVAAELATEAALVAEAAPYLALAAL